MGCSGVLENVLSIFANIKGIGIYTEATSKCTVTRLGPSSKK